MESHITVGAGAGHIIYLYYISRENREKKKRKSSPEYNKLYEDIQRIDQPSNIYKHKTSHT